MATEREVFDLAMAIAKRMFAPHELPLEDKLWAKYLDMARRVLASVEKLREQYPCRRPVNADPPGTTVEQCVAAGHCGCGMRRAYALYALDKLATLDEWDATTATHGEKENK